MGVFIAASHRILLVASSLLTALLAAGAPAAVAHEGHPHGAAQSRVAASMQAALKSAPLESRGRCARAITVAGLGPACRTADGLFRIPGAGGSATTHGLDAPPQPGVAESYSVQSTNALAGASAADIVCVDPALSKHFKLIYAYPSDGTSRMGTIGPLLREEAYKASAFVDAESQSVDATKSKKLRFACDGGGSPTVTEVELPTTTASDSFNSISNDLHTLGLTGGFSLSTKSRLLVFYDAPASSGAAGTGHLYTDDSASSSSPNNGGGLVAVEYRWNDVPHWDVLLHEASHNMGAVQPAALNASSTEHAAHCNDGYDIMCYSDGEAQSAYTTGTCALEYYDCNRDDYFNPSPTGGSYLATHWNVAASYNAYLVHAVVGGGGGDTTPPSAPVSLAASNETSSSVRLTWSASSDDTAVTGYQVFARDANGGSWTPIVTLGPAALTYDVTGLTPATGFEFAVTAFDAASNVSMMTSTFASTAGGVDETAPGAPVNVSVTGRTATSLSIAWVPADGDSYHYGIWIEINGQWYERPGTDQLWTTITGLRPKTTYRFGVIAYDLALNASDLETHSVATLADTVAPTRPSALRITGRTRGSLRLAWDPSVDNVEVNYYVVYMQQGRVWKQVGATKGRTFTKKRIGAGRQYRFRVRARDVYGNMSAWSSIGASRTVRRG